MTKIKKTPVAQSATRTAVSPSMAARPSLGATA